MTPEPIYKAKPYACAILGVVGIATGNQVGMASGALLLAAAGYIMWMRRNY